MAAIVYDTPRAPTKDEELRSARLANQCTSSEIESLRKEIGLLRGVLRQAKHKLECFYKDSEGRYPGGPLYGDLMRAIDERLT